MKWTDKKPTREGYWWFRSAVGHGTAIGVVRSKDGKLDVQFPYRFRELLATFDIAGQWSDEPIPEPSEP